MRLASGIANQKGANRAHLILGQFEIRHPAAITRVIAEGANRHRFFEIAQQPLWPDAISFLSQNRCRVGSALNAVLAVASRAIQRAKNSSTQCCIDLRKCSFGSSKLTIETGALLRI